MGCVYLWLDWFEFTPSFYVIGTIALSLITTIGFASMGYFINEFFDKECDFKAGKVNKLAHLPIKWQSLLLAGILVVTFLPWIWLPKNQFSVFLIAIQIGLFLLYSLPFPRFKEHPYLSLLLDSLYAYTLPLILSFHTFSILKQSQTYPSWFYFFIVAATFIGIRNILTHQIKDVFKDAAAGLQSLPMLIGVNKTQNLLRLVFTYELFFMSISLFVFSLKFWFVFFVLLAYLIFALKVFKENNLNEGSSDFYLEINKAYNIVFPFLTLLMLVVKWPITLVYLLFHAFFLVPFNVYRFILSIVIPFLIKIRIRIHSLVVTDLRNLISVLVNYPIYFIFRIVGIDLKKEGTSALGYFRKRRGVK